jgi:hypothetical protein
MRRHGEAKAELAAAEDRWLALEDQRSRLEADADERDGLESRAAPR